MGAAQHQCLTAAGLKIGHELREMAAADNLVRQKSGLDVDGDLRNTGGLKQNVGVCAHHGGVDPGQGLSVVGHHAEAAVLPRDRAVGVHGRHDPNAEFS